MSAGCCISSLWIGSGQKKQSLKRDSAVCAETDSAETCVRNVGKSWACECLSHTWLFYMTDLREGETVWFLSHTHLFCMSNFTERETLHTNLPYCHFLQLFWFSMNAHAHISVCSHGRRPACPSCFRRVCVWPYLHRSVAEVIASLQSI